MDFVFSIQVKCYRAIWLFFFSEMNYVTFTFTVVSLIDSSVGPRVFCGLADLRTNQWVFCGPKNADCVCGPVGKMRTCGPLKFQLFS